MRRLQRAKERAKVLAAAKKFPDTAIAEAERHEGRRAQEAATGEPRCGVISGLKRAMAAREEGSEGGYQR
jgi:hypothetical protein